MTTVTARMTIQAGTKDKPLYFPKGATFDVPKAEAERLMQIGAVSIGGEQAPPVPLPNDKQPSSEKSPA